MRKLPLPVPLWRRRKLRWGSDGLPPHGSGRVGVGVLHFLSVRVSASLWVRALLPLRNHSMNGRKHNAD